MSGNLVDLSQPNVPIPDPIALDTNVIIAYFQAFFPGQNPRQVSRASALFRDLRTHNQQTILTPTAYSELLHIAVKNHYTRVIQGQQRTLTQQHGVPITSWSDLYKHDPTVLQQFAHNLRLLRQGLVTNNVVIAGPEDYDFVRYPPTLPHGEALINQMARYGLDTSDTPILLEMSQLGLGAVVTMDRDMRRALVDYDVYTWL